AVRLDLGDDNRIRDAAGAVGACSAGATRLPAQKQAHLWHAADADIANLEPTCDISESKPIEDVRATAAYRLEAAREIVARAVEATVAKAAALRTEVAA